MVLKFILKGGGSLIVSPADVEAIDCPNPYGGVGQITFHREGGLAIWTGAMWLYTSRASFAWSNVQRVSVRSDSHDTEEGWIEVASLQPSDWFGYPPYFEFANKVKVFIEGR